MLCVGVLACTPAAYADESPAPFEDSEIRREITLPVSGKPFYYYAQNDPIWADARYELRNGQGYRRTFGGGGCNPTALAMIVANLVDEDDLGKILGHTKDENPITFCQGTISGFFCKNHAKDEDITVDTPDEFKKLLPLVFGNYACYNNDQGRKFRIEKKANSGNGGTTYRMFTPIAEVYGLNLSSTRDEAELFALLDDGGYAIMLCGGAGQPFSEASGHFVVAVDYDDEYLYMLDPQLVEKYTEDTRHILTLVEGEPGLVRVSRDKIDLLCVSYYFMFSV